MRYKLTVIASRECTDGTERQWEGYGGGGEIVNVLCGVKVGQ